MKFLPRNILHIKRHCFSFSFSLFIYRYHYCNLAKEKINYRDADDHEHERNACTYIIRNRVQEEEKYFEHKFLTRVTSVKIMLQFLAQ